MINSTLKSIILIIALLTSSFIVEAQINNAKFKLINKSKKETKLLFNSRSKYVFFNFHGQLFGKWHVLSKDNKFILSFPRRKEKPLEIEILYDTVLVKKNQKTISGVDTIKPFEYKTNRRYIEKDNGDFNVKHLLDTTDYNFKSAKIKVIRHNQRCDDSGVNSIKIIYQNGYILFKHLNNLKFFEYDLDEDGKFEIYIFNYSCCDGKLKIYKVE